MSIYKKYASKVEEQDTNQIYVYMGSYIKNEYTIEEIEEGCPMETEVDINDPRETHRYYGNLECLWTEKVNIQDCEEFEKKHIVLYVDNFYESQKEFIINAVTKDQETAVSKILKKDIRT